MSDTAEPTRDDPRSWRDLLQWCEKQDGSVSMAQVVRALEQHATGYDAMKALWHESTGDECEPPDQTPANVEKFYRAYPVLPVIRPLAQCKLCEFPLMSVMEGIRHYQTAHQVPGPLIADIFRPWVEDLASNRRKFSAADTSVQWQDETKTEE